MKWSSECTKTVDGFTYVPVTFPYNMPDGLLIEDFDTEALIEQIRYKSLQKAYMLGVTDFSRFGKCSFLQHLYIELQLPFRIFTNCERKGNKYVYTYDPSPLYQLSGLRSLTISNNERPDSKIYFSADLENFPQLQLYYGEYGYVKHIESASSLRSLVLSKLPYLNLDTLSSLSNLDTLKLSFSSIQSLHGISAISGLKCLYLCNNRKLLDISDLHSVSKSITALRIQNCPQITDFSILHDMENLELLELWGTNELPDLSFIARMPNLKTFIFNMNVHSGDLRPCLGLRYAYSANNRRHYNLKDEELPKVEFCHGNDSIELWRRLE